MKDLIASLLQNTIESLKTSEFLPDDVQFRIAVDNTRDKSHGDFSTNLAMMLAKPAKKSPREIAKAIIDGLPEHANLEKVEIAGPGFINFFMTQGTELSIINTVLEQADKFGLSEVGAGKKWQIEFVSANPTGPLHVGHGRGAAYGATIANLLEAVGYQIDREYYVNDAGRQIDILATSVWLRYLALCGQEFPFPINGYKGEYIVGDIAQPLFDAYGEKYAKPSEQVFDGVPADEVKDAEGNVLSGDKELHIDGLIAQAKTLLGDDYAVFFDKGLGVVKSDIEDDLSEFGVEYQHWFSERRLTSTGMVDRALTILQEKGYLYEKGGAIWFKSTDFGDDKDRVVKRDNGQTTYFASDIAYHLEKFERGYDRVINIWGADHHGYITRVKASLEALGVDKEKLEVLLVQFANLYRGGERIQMSTRSGSFVKLRELREEVGNDAARFFYVTRKSEQHMDFDLDLAKSQSKDNPVFYIQYAHARIKSVIRKLQQEGETFDLKKGLDNLQQLTQEAEVDLAKQIALYPEVLQKSALNYEPHTLTHYLRELAGNYHTYYNNHKMLIDDKALMQARLTLSEAVAQVIRNGLLLLGVSAPQSM